MNDQYKQPVADQTVEVPRQPLPAASHRQEQGDDRYPGSFFRIPAPPVPGKTSWSLS
ncbi:MAG: hypothetical protein M8364_20130 [Methylobacter sp.]|jgi:hypothetical protein|uniref:hypothetical protein n=1 Tax=Methylobacter TaxID=429 RepID=UPI0003729188|nr:MULTISPECIES: hypothetical protein [Methylobacter]MCL7423200.1 hypothetical protein [Methylobacter sp.]